MFLLCLFVPTLQVCLYLSCSRCSSSVALFFHLGYLLSQLSFICLLSYLLLLVCSILFFYIFQSLSCLLLTDFLLCRRSSCPLPFCCVFLFAPFLISFFRFALALLALPYLPCSGPLYATVHTHTKTKQLVRIPLFLPSHCN